MTTLFLFLFYLLYNPFLHSYFYFILFFNNYFKMALILKFFKGFVSLFVLFICVYISLFQWVYFTYFFDHDIERNICFYSFRSSHCDIFYKIAILNQCSKQIKYVCESVLFLLKFQAMGLHLY